MDAQFSSRGKPVAWLEQICRSYDERGQAVMIAGASLRCQPGSPPSSAITLRTVEKVARC